MTTISIYNLNIMHGRNSKSPVFPLRIKQDEVKQNIRQIVANINSYNPDIVTLQEIDTYSMMSGGFNQADYINNILNFPYSYFAPSFSITLFSKKIFISGNAVFSKFPIENCQSFNFNFSFPTERQGFVVCDVRLPENKTFTITSCHLVWIDWTKINSRLDQLNTLRRTLKQKINIIAGDMNCDLSGKERLKLFLDDLGLKEYEGSIPYTHPSWKPAKTIDWIFIPKSMKFENYEIVKAKLSDHLAVFAKIIIN